MSDRGRFFELQLTINTQLMKTRRASASPIRGATQAADSSVRHGIEPVTGHSPTTRQGRFNKTDDTVTVSESRVTIHQITLIFRVSDWLKDST